MRTRARYGWKPQLPDWRDHQMQAMVPPQLIPPSIDLEPQDSPIFDQGQTSSCTGNSTAAAVEFVRRREGLIDLRVSRLFAYYNGRAAEDDTDNDGGAQIRDVIKGISKFGVCPEVEWAFNPDQVTVKPTDQCYADALHDRAIQYSVPQQNASGLRGCLATKTPFIFGFTVYESFESDAVAKTGIMPMPGSSEGAVGGHAACAVGFFDDRHVVKVRNSWGPQWGDRGYFYMPYDYIMNPDLSSDFWKIQLVSKA